MDASAHLFLSIFGCESMETYSLVYSVIVLSG